MIGDFAAARLQKPDISILSEEFLAEVCGLPHRNLAVKLLRKLLTGELSTRQRRNMVQARSFAEMREHTIRKWQNRAVEAAQSIEELIQLTRDWRGICARPIRATSQRGSMLCEILGGDARASRGRNCRYLDRNGRGFVLTVGTGLGYGLSREPGVAERGSAGRERVDKSEIAGHVADRTGVARSAARDAVDAVFEVIGEAVARGEAGTHRRLRYLLGTTSRPVRTGRNPRNGESLNIAASTVPAFQGRQAVAGCRERRRVAIGVTGDRGQAGTGGPAC